MAADKERQLELQIHKEVCIANINQKTNLKKIDIYAEEKRSARVNVEYAKTQKFENSAHQRKHDRDMLKREQEHERAMKKRDYYQEKEQRREVRLKEKELRHEDRKERKEDKLV